MTRGRAAVCAEGAALRNTRLRIDVSARKSALSNMDRATGLPFTRKWLHDKAAVCAEESMGRSCRLRIDVSAIKPTLSNMGRATGLPFAQNRPCGRPDGRRAGDVNTVRPAGALNELGSNELWQTMKMALRRSRLSDAPTMRRSEWTLRWSARWSWRAGWKRL